MTSLLDLPDELLVHLLTHICSDALLLRLALSCRRTAALLDDAELWIARGGARWGREEMAAGVGESGAEGAKTAKEVYKEKSTLLVPATRMSIVHLNGTYWSLGPDSRSPTAHAATLNSVCWLDLSATLPSVTPGIYLPLIHISFTAHVSYISNIRVETSCQFFLPELSAFNPSQLVSAFLHHLPPPASPLSLPLPPPTPQTAKISSTDDITPPPACLTPRFTFSHARSALGQSGRVWNLAPERGEWVAIAPAMGTGPTGGLLIVPDTVVFPSVTTSSEEGSTPTIPSQTIAINHAVINVRIWSHTGVWKSGLRVAGIELVRVRDGSPAYYAALDGLTSQPPAPAAAGGTTGSGGSNEDPQQGFPYISWDTDLDERDDNTPGAGFSPCGVFWTRPDVDAYVGASRVAASRGGVAGGLPAELGHARGGSWGAPIGGEGQVEGVVRGLARGVARWFAGV